MAASPRYKVYRNGEYIGCAKYAEDAAALVGVGGDIIKVDHRHIVWREGAEAFSAADSYDEAAAVIFQRCEDMRILRS